MKKLLLILTLFTSLAQATDIQSNDPEDVAWECYDYDIYTAEIAAEVVNNPDVFSFDPSDFAELEDFCQEVYDTLFPEFKYRYNNRFIRGATPYDYTK